MRDVEQDLSQHEPPGRVDTAAETQPCDRLAARRLRFTLYVAAVLTVAFGVGLCQRWFPLGIPDQFEYFRVGPWDPPINPWIWLLPAGLAALAMITLVVQSMKRIESASRALFVCTLLGVMVLGGTFQSLLEIVAPGGLQKWAMLYHGFRAAARYEFTDVPAVFEHHAEVAASFEPSHVSTNPAGWIVVYRALLSFFDRHPQAARLVWHFEPEELAWTLRTQLGARAAPLPDQAAATTVGYATRAGALLVALPVAWLVRQRYSRRAALAAAGMAMLVPAAPLLAPAADSIYPTFATLIVALSFHASQRRSWPSAAAAGALIGIGMLFSLSYLVVAAICGLFVALRAAQGHYPTVASVVAAPAAWLGVLLSCGTLLGYNAWSSWGVNLAKNREFNAFSGCTYAPWVPVNLAELAVALGLPAATFLLARLVKAVWKWRDWRLADTVCAAWAITVALLTVSGVNRGEVARLWLFLMPMAAAFAVESLDFQRRAVRAVLAAVLVLQSFHCLLLGRELAVLAQWLLHDATQLIQKHDQWLHVRRLTDEELRRRGIPVPEFDESEGIHPAQKVYLWSASKPMVGIASDEQAYERFAHAAETGDRATLDELTANRMISLVPQNIQATVVKTGKRSHLVGIIHGGAGSDVYVGVDDVHHRPKEEGLR